MDHPDRQKKFQVDCVIPCESFKHSVGTETIDKQITWNHILLRYQDKTNHYYYI